LVKIYKNLCIELIKKMVCSTEVKAIKLSLYGPGQAVEAAGV
jgi:hypothetical protein